MGIALYLVWQKGITNKPVKTAIVIFFVQLALNTLWPFMFFGMRSTLAGLLCIIPLWAAIIVTAALFFRISRAAGWLLIPYLLWVSFAVILNFRIWQQN
jgi:tryptophan-rich sensory protein